MMLFKFKIVISTVFSRLDTTENQRREPEDKLKTNSRNYPTSHRKNNSKR